MGLDVLSCNCHPLLHPVLRCLHNGNTVFSVCPQRPLQGNFMLPGDSPLQWTRTACSIPSPSATYAPWTVPSGFAVIHPSTLKIGRAILSFCFAGSAGCTYALWLEPELEASEGEGAPAGDGMGGSGGLVQFSFTSAMHLSMAASVCSLFCLSPRPAFAGTRCFSFARAAFCTNFFTHRLLNATPSARTSFCTHRLRNNIGTASAPNSSVLAFPWPSFAAFSDLTLVF